MPNVVDDLVAMLRRGVDGQARLAFNIAALRINLLRPLVIVGRITHHKARVVKRELAISVIEIKRALIALFRDLNDRAFALVVYIVGLVNHFSAGISGKFLVSQVLA